MTILEDIQDVAQDMIDDDSERDKELFQKVDELWKSDSKLPPSLAKLGWIRQVKSTDAHDEILTATRMFANKREIIKFNPYDDSNDATTNANKIEKSLAWNMHQVNRRNKISARWDFMLSSLKYNAISAQLDYLPYKKKIKGIKTPRQKAMEAYGDFNLIRHNPQYVHAEYSDGMLERVVTNRTMQIRNLIDFWGKDKVKFDDEESEEVTVYDFTGYVNGDLRRAVWFSTSPSPTDAATGPVIVDPDTEEGKLDLPFIPWIIAFGGSSLEYDPRHQYNPLLYSVINSGQVATLDIVKTLVLSEAIAHAASPRWLVTGPGAEEVEVDWGDPSGKVVAPAGTTATPLPPPQADQALLQFASMFQNEMDKGTVSGLLSISGGANTSYATWNLVLQSNLAAILQYKEQAQLALGEVYTMMLLWAHSQGKNLIGYGMDKTDKGQKYVVTPQDFDPDNLHIEVELLADLPTSRSQEVNTAVMLHREFPVSAERMMEELGYEDPEGEMKKSFYEKRLQLLEKAEETKTLGEIQAGIQIQSQAAMAGLQRVQQQGPPQQSPSGPTSQQQPMPGPQGLPQQLQGEGMDTNAGGSSPSNFMPQATREQQSGQTATGEGVVAP